MSPLELRIAAASGSRSAGSGSSASASTAHSRRPLSGCASCSWRSARTSAPPSSRCAPSAIVAVPATRRFASRDRVRSSGSASAVASSPAASAAPARTTGSSASTKRSTWLRGSAPSSVFASATHDEARTLAERSRMPRIRARRASSFPGNAPRASAATRRTCGLESSIASTRASTPSGSACRPSPIAASQATRQSGSSAAAASAAVEAGSAGRLARPFAAKRRSSASSEVTYCRKALRPISARRRARA